jgi:hypothetical protein
MKVTQQFVLVDEDGNETDLDRNQFLKYVVEQTDLPAMPALDEEKNPIEGETAFTQLETANMLLQLYEEGGREDWEHPALQPYKNHFQTIDEWMADSEKALKTREANKKEEAEAAKAQKEEDKKAKEEEKALVVAKRNVFLESAKKGTDKATKAFKSQVEEFAKTLPKGVTVNADTMSLVFDQKSLTPEVLGETLGALSQGEQNFKFMKDGIAWFMGDTTNAFIGAGIFKSALQAGKELVKMFDEKGIKTVSSGRLFERYSRMARECPPELRNRMVDPTAYLAIAEAAAPKKLPQESVTVFNGRKDKHAKDKQRLYEAAKDGKITVAGEDGKDVEMEIRNRRDIIPLVDNLQVKHGIKKMPDPSIKKPKELLEQFFFCSRVIDLWDDFPNKNEDEVVFQKGSDLYCMSRSDAVTLLEEAKNELDNILLRVEVTSSDVYTVAEMLSGVRTVKRAQKVEDEDGKFHVKKDDAGNVVYDEVEVETYPPLLVREKHATLLECEEEEAVA